MKKSAFIVKNITARMRIKTSPNIRKVKYLPANLILPFINITEAPGIPQLK